MAFILYFRTGTDELWYDSGHSAGLLGQVMNCSSLLTWTISALALTAGSLVANSTLGSHFRTATAMDIPQPVSATFAELPKQHASLFASSVGSAFSVAPGLLVTDAHVTLRCNAERRPIQVAGYQATWQVVQEDQNLDLALLRGPDNPAIPPVALSAAPQIARDTWTLILGFPVDAAPSDAAHGVLGRVQRAAIIVHRPGSGQAESFRMTDRTGHTVEPTWQDGAAFFGQIGSERMRWALEITASIGHGASGGPIVDGAGNVVGIIVADGTNQGSVSAIPIADLIDFMGSAGVIPRFAPPPQPGEIDWSRAYRRTVRSVVRVGC
jgi:S1-C subfamily serine protease